MVKVFIGGFPLDIQEMELAMLFAPHGDISTLKIVRDKKTRVCKGYAFIEMVDRAGAENAVEVLNGTMIAGKALNVNINEEPIVKPTTVLSSNNYGRQPVYQKVQRPGMENKKKRPRRII